MADHNCIQEHKLGEIESKLNRIDKELFNGEGGLVKSVPVLSENVEQLNESVKDLRTVISGFAKFQAEAAGKKKLLTDFRLWLTVIISASALTFAFLSNKKTNATISDDRMYLEWKMRFKQDKVLDSTVRALHGGVTLDTTLMFINE